MRHSLSHTGLKKSQSMACLAKSETCFHHPTTSGGQSCLCVRHYSSNTNDKPEAASDQSSDCSADSRSSLSSLLFEPIALRLSVRLRNVLRQRKSKLSDVDGWAGYCEMHIHNSLGQTSNSGSKTFPASRYVWFIDSKRVVRCGLQSNEGAEPKAFNTARSVPNATRASKLLDHWNQKQPVISQPNFIGVCQDTISECSNTSVARNHSARYASVSEKLSQMSITSMKGTRRE